MNDMIYETIMWIDCNKISFINIDVFILEMKKNGIAMKIVSDDVISSSYRIKVQKRNINESDLKVIAKYIQKHNIQIKSLANDIEWIMFVPEFYAKVNGIEYVPPKEAYECDVKKQKYDSDDLSTIF